MVANKQQMGSARHHTRRVPRKHYAVLLGTVVIIAGTFVLLVGPSRMASAGPLSLVGYDLTFDEEFKTLDVSAGGPGTRWIAHTPWHGDFGDAVFDNPGPSGPFSVSPDGLAITARKDASGRWHSGLLCSRDQDGAEGRGFAQRYGYFEISTKLPPGPGTWPAFWLIGTDKSTSSSEIDVFEYYGKFIDSYHAVTHIWEKGGDRFKNTIVNVPSGSLTDRFNTFGVSIEPETTRFYLNREEKWEVPTPPEYRQPFYVLVNLALGSGWSIDGLQSPAVMNVKYVKVWQKSALKERQ